MMQQWTFSRKLGAGLALVVVLVALLSTVAIYALIDLDDTMDEVLTGDARRAILASRLDEATERRVSSVRAYLLTGSPDELEMDRQAKRDFKQKLEQVQSLPDPSGRLVRDIRQIVSAARKFAAAEDRIIERKQRGEDLAGILSTLRSDVASKQENLERATGKFFTHAQTALRRARSEAQDQSVLTVVIVSTAAGVVMILAVLLAVFLSRALNRQVGAAVRRIESSSTELQSAANQQAAGIKEQTTAMNETTTTLKELVSTSKQISVSAQNVAEIATDATGSAEKGRDAVATTEKSVEAIKEQVDGIVGHMLDLGKKSQQIGGVLDIINELAEQTNILAINASIEAAGAGEAGSRFGVVAEEIRKLADRVAGSTKEIRKLIEEVRAAVNNTVMATEGGTKAVEQGRERFAQVNSLFDQIAERIGTTSDAAREIELSTKQQSTAVEQVNSAVANATQATKESEASTSQTLETASELVSLSNELSRLVRPSQ